MENSDKDSDFYSLRLQNLGGRRPIVKRDVAKFYYVRR